MTDTFDQTRTAIAADLKLALKSRDRVGVAALRGALNALDNATSAGTVAGGATEVPRLRLSSADLSRTLQREIDARSAAAGEYRRLGRNDLAADFSREADVIRGCLRHLGGEPGTTAP